MLKNEKVQQKYSKNVGEYIKNIELSNMDKDWATVSKAIKEIAVEYVSKIKNKKKK